MDKAKIRLSPKEAELVGNAEWILTKNKILQKVKLILEELQVLQRQLLLSAPQLLPAEVIAISPKVAKGENYKGLPYLVLDHPRYFGKEDQFAIRTMFWWGNFFSITLHLSGKYKSRYQGKLHDLFDSLKQHDYFIGVSDDQWEHHFEASNYQSLGDIDEKVFAATMNDKRFIKLAKRVSLKQWDDAGELLFASFSQLVNWLISVH